MTATLQTNTTLRAIADELARRDDIVICGHVSPDGDCIGSQLALMHALRSLGKRVACVLAEDEGCIDESFSFLPGIGEIVPPSSYDGPIGVFVGVDVPTVERIGDASALHGRAAFKVTVDHHAVESTMSDLVYVDPDAAATALLVWKLAVYLMERRDERVATCAYTGLVTDTGRFQYQNTDAASLVAASEMVASGADPAMVAREVFQNRRLASIQLEARAIERMVFTDGGSAVASWLSIGDFEELGASKPDAEPIINSLRSVKGVRVACMLREQDHAVRGSLRAKDDTDVSVLARRFGGGGHKAAAGFTLEMELDQAFKTVLEAMAGLVSGDSGPDSGEGALR